MVGFQQLHLRPSRSLRMAVILFRLQVRPGFTQPSAPRCACQTIVLLVRCNVSVPIAVTYRCLRQAHCFSLPEFLGSRQYSWILAANILDVACTCLLIPMSFYQHTGRSPQVRSDDMVKQKSKHL